MVFHLWMGDYAPNLLGTVYFENPNPVLEIGNSFFSIVTQIFHSGKDAAN